MGRPIILKSTKIEDLIFISEKDMKDYLKDIRAQGIECAIATRIERDDGAMLVRIVQNENNSTLLDHMIK